MSRFASQELRTIDLGDGEWVKVRKSVSFAEGQSLQSAPGSEEEKSIEMFLFCIREWNLKNEEGIVPELNRENLLKLDLQTIDFLNKILLPLFQNDQDKKK
jgi:hypothetical protein